MSDDAFIYLLGFGGGFCIGAIVCGAVYLVTPNYRNGQIDCINGDIRYELKLNPDNSVSWVAKAGNK